MFYKDNHRSLQEAVQAVRLAEGRANDDQLALDELAEAQNCLEQAIRHIKTADNYASNDYSQLASIIEDAMVAMANEIEAINSYGDEDMYESDVSDELDRDEEIEESDCDDDILDEGLFSGGRVKRGSTVELIRTDGNKDGNMTIVVDGDTANSPPGRAVMGKKKGDRVTVTGTPANGNKRLEYEIVRVR